MKFQIGDKIYDGGALDDLSLKYILQLEKETADFGHPMNINTINVMSDELSALSEKQQQKHPNTIWITAVSIWAARKLAGEKVTFEEAVDFPMRLLKIIPDPQDHKPPLAKPRPRKGGGVGAEQPADSEPTPT